MDRKQFLTSKEAEIIAKVIVELIKLGIGILLGIEINEL